MRAEVSSALAECQENTVNDPREDFLSGPQLKQQPLTSCLIVFTPHSITRLHYTSCKLPGHCYKYSINNHHKISCCLLALRYSMVDSSTPIIAHSDLSEAAESLWMDGGSQGPAKKTQFYCKKPSQIPSSLTQYPSLATSSILSVSGHS